MQHFRFSTFTVSVMLASVITGSANSSELDKVYLCVVSDSTLVPANSSIQQHSTIIRRGTIVVGLQRVARKNVQGWSVISSNLCNEKFAGWIPASNVQTPDNLASVLLSTKRDVRIKSESNGPRDEFPELIARQSNSIYRDAWQQVHQAFLENSKLPPDQQLPEPFFARGDVWRSVGSNQLALSDYLDGILVVRRRKLDLTKYSDEFEKLSETTKLARVYPEAATGSHSNLEDFAASAFSKAVDRYRSKDYSQAVYLASESISCEPEESVYWYYRSVSYFQNGDIDHAIHDALIGSFMERRTSNFSRKSNSRALTHVQGKPRTFLEGFRNGTAQISPR